MTKCVIVSATTKNCIDYQDTSAAFAKDAMFLREEGMMVAAIVAQQNARMYHDAAWHRLARLIGVE
jgi:NAD(P)H-dependent FMN reductase